MLWSPFSFFWHLPMGWVWLGRHCGTKLYPTHLWGDCQGLLEVDWTCAQYCGRIFLVYKCLLCRALGMQKFCIKAHLKCITRWNIGWYTLNTASTMLLGMEGRDDRDRDDSLSRLSLHLPQGGRDKMTLCHLVLGAGSGRMTGDRQFSCIG